eukprot:TRINITY_DN3559_c1_g1_i2.p1 TRINITY_DN3559_c1_g1~~TRINITY_DN3559_c1_g1_i2.p1  ORF type:complete len:319 (-),score=66.20 TRINITY_DN3559_c1_g1_i2:3-959(-)
METETKKRKNSEDKEPPFSKRLEECFSLFKSLHKEIEERIEVLELKEEHQENLQKQVEEAFGKTKSQINLNVGGQRFSTSRSTLTSIEDTYFYAMLSSDQWKPNEYGEYFVDRSPKYFQRIIDFMRSGELIFDDLSGKEKKEIKIELDYYQIPIPESLKYEKWHWDPQKKGKYITLTENNTIATCLKKDKINPVVIGNKSVDRFRIKILSHKNCEEFQSFVGLVPTRDIDLEDCPEKYWAIGLDKFTLMKDGDYITSDLKYERKVGDEIEFYHNQEEGTITLYINKEGKGIVFSDVPIGVELYPFFEGNGTGASIQIV